MGYIYKITNKVNKKVYIGQTILPPIRRWRQHELSSLNTSKHDNHLPIHKAMAKYGLNNFQYDVIEECDDSNINAREIYWIAFYNSTNPSNGYNLSLGGGGTAYYDMALIKELWDQGKSIQDIAHELDLDRGFLAYRLKSIGITQEDINTRRYATSVKKLSFPVYQYLLSGKFVRKYSSVQEARQKTGIGHIEKCCNGNQKQAGGYIWSYSKCEIMQPVQNDNPATRKRPVFQYDLSGKQVASFPSAYHAEKETRIASDAIRNVCKGKSHTAGGYVWSYIDTPAITIVLSNNTGKPKRIGMYDIATGELLRQYDSLASAARENNISISGISAACSGRYKQCGGYIWRYLSD